jgi:dCTP deaminase
MSMLTGPEICNEIADNIRGGIRIKPFSEEQVNPNSYNLRLGAQMLVYKKAWPLHEMQTDLDYLQQRWDNGEFVLDEQKDTARQHMKALRKGLSSFRMKPLDMAVEEETVELNVPTRSRFADTGYQGGIVLYPGVLYLGHTVEYTESTKFVPAIEGRSSVGRLGICIHVTAGFGDIGFRGDWTLEITVVHPTRVYAETEVCQIAFTTTKGTVQPYEGRYQGQSGPKPSGLWRDFVKEKK